MFLMLFHPQGYREIPLSGMDNLDCTVTLDAQEYGLRAGAGLHLEAVSGRWRVLEGTGCTVQGPAELGNGTHCRLVTRAGETVQMIAVDVRETLPVSRKIDLSGVDELTFGSGEGCGVRYDFMGFVSRRHGSFVRSGGAFWLCDTSSNGLYCNGRKVSGRQMLRFGDRVDAFGLTFVYLGSVLCVMSRTGAALSVDESLRCVSRTAWNVVRPEPDRAPAEILFNRSPRVRPELYTGEVTVEAVPAPRFSQRKPLMLLIGPSFTMALPMLLGCLLAVYGSRTSGMGSSVFLYTGMVTALASAALGVLWAVLNLRHSRREEFLAEQHRTEAYGAYLMGVARELRAQYEYNVRALHQTYPPAAECCRFGVHTPQLWSRNRSHGDFLFCRLGLGERPFPVEVKIPKEGFELDPDELRAKPAVLRREYSVMRNVPVGVDLRETLLLGVAGPQARDVVYAMIAQLAASNCYTDVRILFAGARDDAGGRRAWDFLKWLPHTWNETRTTRRVALSAADRADLFGDLLETLRRRDAAPPGQRAEAYDVLFVEDPSLLAGEMVSNYIFRKDPALGLTTVLMAAREEDLPNECEDVVAASPAFCGVCGTAEGRRTPVAFDRIGAAELEGLCRNLAVVRVQEKAAEGDIPSRLDFLGMYGVRAVEQLGAADRWRKSRTDSSMRVPVGKKAGGALCCLDAHEKYHGPHGLVAGTTGSGKSETLQTYILSLALQFSPHDVGFFLIDFKGGGMANLFEGLPHMLGSITNLSGNQVRRAMISIKSENRRRQRLFNECEVNSIGAYTQLYRSGAARVPVPHLFIIIDEFAELKREQPDFMRELISVAQVGRSLGVHLILATQKPSGTVDDNIWSNAKFRLCLRVQDRQDSNDMLHRPDAAFITQAGRGFLQVGNDEVFEEFQSAWSGAPYDPEGSRAQAAVLVTRTGREAVVGSRAAASRREAGRTAWLAELARRALALCPELPDGPGQERLAQLCRDMADSAAPGEPLRTASERSALMRFVSLWPTGCTDPDEAARAAAAAGGALPAPRTQTQLSALVEYLARTAREEAYAPCVKLWLPPLPERIFLDDLAAPETPDAPGGLRAPAALLDDPENQTQTTWCADFGATGHLAVLGGVVSGKSTFLQTLVYSLFRRYTPDRLHAYLLDFSSRMLAPFADDAHVGALVNENDGPQTGRLMSFLTALMDERRALLGGGTYAQYVRAYGPKVPAVLVVLDNYAAFAEKTGGRFEPVILRLAREGVSYGMYLAVSAAGIGVSELPARIADNLRGVVCLDLADRFRFAEALHTTRLSVLPESGVPGRGLVQTENGVLEFQAALALDAQDDYARGRAIAQECAQASADWTGACARRVPCIPDEPVYSDLHRHDAFAAAAADPARLPFAYDMQDASLHAVDLSDCFCYTILGRARTGKTNTLKVLMQAASEKGGRVAVFEKGSRLLEETARRLGAEYLASDADVFAYWKRMSPVFAQRNRRKQELLAHGSTDREIFDAMQAEPPVFLFIDGLRSYLSGVYSPEPGVGAMSGFTETIFSRGALHNIYLFATAEPDDFVPMAGYPAFASFTSQRRGVLLGGNPAGQRMFQFRNIPFQEQSKVLGRGVGLTPDAADETCARTIVIPLAER